MKEPSDYWHTYTENENYAGALSPSLAANYGFMAQDTSAAIWPEQDPCPGIRGASVIARNPGSIFVCPHCGIGLSVPTLPAYGTCPSCEGHIYCPVSGNNSMATRTIWLQWLIIILLTSILIWFVILIHNRIGLDSLDIGSYQPSHDNRFAAWPWSDGGNPGCHVPPQDITGIGWDGRGASHALVDPCFIAITHNTPPEKVNFRDGSGRKYTRKIISYETVSYDSPGLARIRLCRLSKPLPPGITPLPILDVAGRRRIDLPLYVVGRHGRIGHEIPGVVRIYDRQASPWEEPSPAGVLECVQQPARAGYARLRIGDSGSPVIARSADGWSLVGLTLAIRKAANPGDSPDTHVHALLSPHFPGIAIAGANPSTIPLPRRQGTDPAKGRASADQI